MPSERTSSRTVFLWIEAEQALADPGLAAGGLQERRTLAGLLGPHGGGDAVVQDAEPVRELGREREQQLGGRLGVRQGPMGLLELDAEERREVAQAIRLSARVALAGDDERVEVPALLEPVPVAPGRLDERQVEADRVADDERLAGERDERLGGLLGARSALDVLVGDAVHLVAEDRPRADRRTSTSGRRCACPGSGPPRSR